MESSVQQFWQNNPCGAELVGDLTDKSRVEYEAFFARYDEYRYTKESHILKCLDAINFDGKSVLEIGLGQGADGEQIVLRGGIYSGVDLTDEAANRTRMRFMLKDLPFERIEQASALSLPSWVRSAIHASPIASVMVLARAGLHSASQRRGVTPLVLLLNRSGKISAKSLTVVLRSRSE